MFSEQPHIPQKMHNSQSGNPPRIIKIQNSRFTNQTMLATVDENSLEAAPQTESPCSHVENCESDVEQGMGDDESLDLQTSQGSAEEEDKARRYNVQPPERATRLRVSRIKNIMKFDPDVNIITQEAAYLVAKCAEQFVENLAKAAYESMQTHKRKTMQKKDVENAVLSEVKYTFLDGLENLYIY